MKEKQIHLYCILHSLPLKTNKPFQTAGKSPSSEDNKSSQASYGMSEDNWGINPPR